MCSCADNTHRIRDVPTFIKKKRYRYIDIDINIDKHIVQLYTIIFLIVKFYHILPTRPSTHHSDISPCKSCDLRSAANKSKSQAKMSKHKVKQCSLLEGKFTSVLNTDFVVATETKGFNQRDVLLPFILKQLPTKEETLNFFI